jgi:hypothetical protein
MSKLPTSTPEVNHFATAPINGGAICSRCKSAELVENGQDLDCANCGCPRIWVEQPWENLPSPCSWLGFVRLGDQHWRCVAAAETLPKLWECLLTFPLNGDRLAWPVRRMAA